MLNTMILYRAAISRRGAIAYSKPTLESGTSRNRLPFDVGSGAIVGGAMLALVVAALASHLSAAALLF